MLLVDVSEGQHLHPLVYQYSDAVDSQMWQLKALSEALQGHLMSDAAEIAVPVAAD